jgi:hypothetical protein
MLTPAIYYLTFANLTLFNIYFARFLNCVLVYRGAVNNLAAFKSGPTGGQREMDGIYYCVPRPWFQEQYRTL